jgi:L-ribulose-5-phosphate 3-epimerase
VRFGIRLYSRDGSLLGRHQEEQIGDRRRELWGMAMHRVGVCSWSLRPRDAADLAARALVCGVDAVQLALDPVRDGRWAEAGSIAALRAAGITVLSGMMVTVGEDYSTLESIKRTGGLRPDGTWKQNLEAARANATLAARLELKLVTFHAGFLPHDSADGERARMIERLRQVADVFAAAGVSVALETGQESAETLLRVLTDLGHPRLGVNFDPANMILYGMGEPVDALERLAPWVKQVHIQDALPSERAVTWGREVAAGSGAVDWDRFFAVLERDLPDVNLVIEMCGAPSD